MKGDGASEDRTSELDLRWSSGCGQCREGGGGGLTPAGAELAWMHPGLGQQCVEGVGCGWWDLRGDMVGVWKTSKTWQNSVALIPLITL